MFYEYIKKSVVILLGVGISFFTQYSCGSCADVTLGEINKVADNVKTSGSGQESGGQESEEEVVSLTLVTIPQSFDKSKCEIFDLNNSKSKTTAILFAEPGFEMPSDDLNTVLYNLGQNLKKCGYKDYIIMPASSVRNDAIMKNYTTSQQAVKRSVETKNNLNAFLNNNPTYKLENCELICVSSSQGGQVAMKLSEFLIDECERPVHNLFVNACLQGSSLIAFASYMGFSLGSFDLNCPGIQSLTPKSAINTLSEFELSNEQNENCLSVSVSSLVKSPLRSAKKILKNDLAPVLASKLETLPFLGSLLAPIKNTTGDLLIGGIEELVVNPMMPNIASGLKVLGANGSDGLFTHKEQSLTKETDNMKIVNVDPKVDKNGKEVETHHNAIYINSSKIGNLTDTWYASHALETFINKLSDFRRSKFSSDF